MTNTVSEAVLAQSRKDLVEQSVLRQGHFERHDGGCALWYFDTEPLIYSGSLWRIVQDLVGVIPRPTLNQIEIVAGAQSIGDVMATGIANMIASGGREPRQVGCVPIMKQFELVGRDFGKTVYTIKKFYRERLKGKKVLLVDNVFATGRNSTKFTRLLEDAGATVVASAYIADLCSMKSTTRHSLWQESATDVFRRMDCPKCKERIPFTKF